jgi:hypothetical protein
MTVEERLDKLTERHEALTQFVELMAHMQRDHDEKNQALMTQVIQSIDSLSRIAHLHERRISDLEDRQT